MRGCRMVPLLTLILLVAVPAAAQQTPAPMVATYDSLADAILALKQAEADFVTSVLQLHHGHALAAYQAGDHDEVAAQMALFANEGDNAIAGIRNRLVEGGHHHHGGETADLYDPGFVVVTKEAKAAILQAAAAMRDAADDMAATTAWERFDEVATPLISPE